MSAPHHVTVPLKRITAAFPQIPLAVIFATSLAATQPVFAAEKPAAGLPAREVEFFEQKVRPLLVKHCYECHAEENGGEIKGGLRLDVRAGWEAGGDSGPAIVPRKPAESLLIEAVKYESFEMPPAGRLPAEEIAILEEWVARGAIDPRDGDAAVPARPTIDLEEGRRFWAFQPPQRTEAPEVKDTDWPRDDLDRYILAKLEAAGLAPAADADRRTWIRRITFDLIGLPPTPEEISAFLADNSPEAREKVVDRLLGSPHFGEHWGRHWLDVARYADSNGSDFNATFYNAWRYRNYVIDAFNRDKPFDQFAREQIAGDLLPAENDYQRAEQLVGSTFLMLGPKMLSERDKEKLEMDIVDEQVDSFGRAFLGLTIGCARCHDHKFDPIPTHDYYALAGIFTSTITIEGESQQYVSAWKTTPLPIEEEHARLLAEYEKQHSAMKKQVAEAAGRIKAAEKQLANSSLLKLGVLVDDIDAVKVGKWKSSTYSPLFVGKGYVHDDKQDKGNKSITFTPELTEPGMYEVRISFAGGSGRDAKVPVTITHAEGTETLLVDQTKVPEIEKLFHVVGRFRFDSGREGKLTISTENTTEFVLADAAQFIPVAELEAKDKAADKSQQATAAAEELKALKKAHADLEANLKEFEKTAPPPAPVAFAPRERKDPADCELCVRGNHLQRGPAIPRGFLQVVSSDKAKVTDRDSSGRQELAEWVTDPQNPLTARVMVNRIWKHLLGEGIVRSVDNFGQLGDRPTHPELLDRLALDFIDSGWSTQAMIRRIALSHTYQMSSRHDDRGMAADPENRLLWRAHRRRLTAESIRDSLLMISGRLDRTQGESPVASLGRLAVDNSKQETGSRRSTALRRSIYLPIVRNVLPEILTTFDFADPDVVTGRRPVTNVPAQALLLMNSPFVRDAAEATAERLLEEESPENRQRISRAYELILGRLPDEGELQRIEKYLDSTDSSAEGENTEADLTSFSQVVQALFASTEFRMLD